MSSSGLLALGLVPSVPKMQPPPAPEQAVWMDGRDESDHDNLSALLE